MVASRYNSFLWFVPHLPFRIGSHDGAIEFGYPGKQQRIYFEDEVPFEQQGTLTQIWTKRGTRPCAVRQTEYGDLWALGVFCPATGHAEGLLSPRLNTAVVNTFLAQFSRTIPEQEHAVLIWDGAGFHTSRALKAPANITVANLWRYLKSHFWSNRPYDNDAAGPDDIRRQ